MTTIPSHLARVPNMLTTQLMAGSINRANAGLVELQVQLSSGKRLLRPSDDPIGNSAVHALDDVIERRDQRLRNLSHADAVLGNVDAALGDLSNILIEAKGIAASQIGVGSDAVTRANQAQVIDAMLSEAINIANRRYQEVQLFGGTATAEAPIEGLLGGLRYLGEGEGLYTDLGLSRPVPITSNGEDAFGALSARVEGALDLDPAMSPATRLLDLNGARGLGVALGSIEVDIGGTVVSVDLTNAHTIADVTTALEAAIQPLDAGATVQIDPLTGNRIEITGNALAITISDPTSAATAADLGLDTTFAPGGGVGSDVDPRIIETTPLASLGGLTIPLGTIRIENVGQVRDLDLSGAVTVQDLVNLVEGLDLGVRVEIAGTGDRLDFINELSGGEMSIGEVGGGTTATELGVRSLDLGTNLADFNDSLGVQFIDGSVDPLTGLPDPARDLDFRVTTKDGTIFDVDLDASDATVQDVLDAINTAAVGAGLTVGVDFEAALVPDGNGILLTDNTPPVGGATTVEALNGSFAAADLGILGSTTSATLAGEDRARVAVDSLFSHLIALRDALLTNDERGITLAGGRIETDVTRVTEARAEAGVRNRRITDATTREEDQRIQDMSLRSQIQDLDFTEAAIRFSLLQQQLQAGLTTASRLASMSLLDFLG